MLTASRVQRSSTIILPRLAMILLAMIGLGMLWIASGVLLPTALQRLSERLQGVVTVFLSIVIEALPFLLAGVFTSSAIHLFVSPERVRRLAPRSLLLAALVGAWLGLLFPVCECGSVPTARRLLAKGAPLPLGLAFVLAAPAVNPVVIASTWVAFGGNPTIVLMRIGLTVVIATIVGLVLGTGIAPEQVLARLESDDVCDHDHHDHATSWLGTLLGHASSEFFDMGRYLVIGAAIAATLQIFVPQEALLALGQGPVLSAAALMGLAVVLSICSTVDAFVALAFANSVLPGSLLAFLVFGPMIDLKSILMLTTTFRRRTVALIVLLTVQLVLLAAVAINLYG
jgi:uncharacterized membrane protein YraQ (UPF0718 family)